MILAPCGEVYCKIWMTCCPAPLSSQVDTSSLFASSSYAHLTAIVSTLCPVHMRGRHFGQIFRTVVHVILAVTLG